MKPSMVTRTALRSSLAALLLCATGASDADTQALPPGALRVQRADIIDSNGFERPLVAASILIPMGWQAQGGVYWNVRATCGSGYNFNWRAAAPDGSMGVAIIPSATWTSNNFSAPPGDGCTNAAISSVRQYLEGLVQQSRPGARVLDFRRREDLEKDYQALNNTMPTAMGEIRSWVEAGELLIAYDQSGRDMRETVAAVALFSLSRMQGINPGQTMESLQGTALPGYAFRAPNGQLDFRMAETIRTSIRPGAEWQARINKHNQQVNQVALDESRKRSQIITQTNNEIFDMQQKSWEARQASQDRNAREFGETIRAVETYNDPDSSSGGTIELSSQYDNAWKLRDGSYVLTNDPSFDPYRATGMEGQKLEPTQ